MKRYVYIIFGLILVVLCSCTAENDKKPLICEKLFVKSSENGFDIYAFYTTSGKDSTKSGEKTVHKYSESSAQGVLDKLISSEDDAMFKPIKSLVLLKDEKRKKEIVTSFINRSELQLKCTVYEVQGSYFDEENLGEGLPFPEYYRQLFGGEK